MALMLGSLREALVAAGAPEEKADAAAEEAAGYENRLAKLEADVALLKWMVGTVIVLCIGILWKVMTL